MPVFSFFPLYQVWIHICFLLQLQEVSEQWKYTAQCPFPSSEDKANSLVLLPKRTFFSVLTPFINSPANVHVKLLRMTEAFVLQIHQYMDCIQLSVFPSLSFPAPSSYLPPSIPCCFLNPQPEKFLALAQDRVIGKSNFII